jgi:sec-independent protein translocase protein TatA
MFNGLTGWHALVLLVIVVLIFGAAKLPGLAKSVGQSMKIFKNEVKPESTATLDSTATDGAKPTGSAAEGSTAVDSSKSTTKP